VSRDPFLWPDSTQLLREIEQANRGARRLAALRRRQNRREWAKQTACALFIVGCGVFVFWVLGGTV
jgi:ferric-dicitrate binding protein FerR (iron transport regulator)